MLFMCWTRETGVIPAALAGLLLGMKAPGAQMIASVTFIAILITILIQAPTTKWLGGKLRLLEKRLERSAQMRTPSLGYRTFVFLVQSAAMSANEAKAPPARLDRPEMW